MRCAMLNLLFVAAAAFASHATASSIEKFDLPMSDHAKTGLGIATPAAYVLDRHGEIQYSGVGDLVTGHVPRVLDGIAAGKAKASFATERALAGQIAAMLGEHAPDLSDKAVREGLEKLAGLTGSSLLQKGLQGGEAPLVIAVLSAPTATFTCSPCDDFKEALEAHLEKSPGARGASVIWVTLHPPAPVGTR